MIEIYGTSNCGYCKQAVSLCESKSLAYEYISLDDRSKMPALEARIGSKVRTVPQIFKDNVYIDGGFTGLKAVLA